MSYEVIKFRKTYETRYEDYRRIFSICKRERQMDVFDVWSVYLECSVEPHGWTGYWKMPRHTCNEFEVPFPNEPIVKVKSVDFERMTASVSVEYVDNYVNNFPLQFNDVLLKDIHPIAGGKDSDLCVMSTAESLDQLRIFMNYLWHPWDTEGNISVEDFVDNYLEPRLQLYYYLVSPTTSYSVLKEHIWVLLRRSRKIHSLMQDSVDVSDYLKLRTYREELQLIQHQLNTFEDSEERLKWISEWKQRKCVQVFVTQPCTFPEYKKLVALLTTLINPKLDMISLPDLQDALYNVSPGGILVVNYGHYGLDSIGNLTEGGTLKGLSGNDLCVIFDHEPPRALIEVCTTSGNRTTLENLVIESNTCKNTIVVIRGTLVMSSVVIKRVTSIPGDGILLCEGATMIARNCKFSGFETAITSLEGSTATLENCTFENNHMNVHEYENN